MYIHAIKFLIRKFNFALLNINAILVFIELSLHWDDIVPFLILDLRFSRPSLTVLNVIKEDS